MASERRSMTWRTFAETCAWRAHIARPPERRRCCTWTRILHKCSRKHCPRWRRLPLVQEKR